MNIQKMMKEAQKMQERLAKAQNDLAEQSVEASSGGGKVTVTATGAGDITAIKLAPEVVDPQDVEMLEDLVLAAINDARTKVDARVSEEMAKVTGGLPLPPGLKF